MRIKTMAVLFMALLLGSGSTAYATSQEKGSTANPLQQTIYFGGDILTMQGDQPGYVEAIMVHDGKIIYTGDKVSAVNNFAGETIEIDLKGKTMMPAFCEQKTSSTGPTKAANNLGIVTANLTDSKTTQPDPFFVMWTAIKKETGSGNFSGSDQTMDIYAALQNMTTGSVCFSSEEERKGTACKFCNSRQKSPESNGR